MPKILVSNTGFGQASPTALSLLQQHGDVFLNEKSIKYDDDTMTALCQDADVIIAGTEKISARAINNASRLKLIARIGVGVDSVDLKAAQERRVSLTYTPEAPSQAIPEFTLSLMLNLIKQIGLIDRKMHTGTWHKVMGRMLSSMTIGVIGAGRIGAQLIALLQALNPHQTILFYDPVKDEIPGAKKASLDDIFHHSDIITLHLPLLETTRGLIGADQLTTMKAGSFLINTARGGIVDEHALFNALQSGHLAGAAVDVFEQEPYNGPLSQLDNCLLTAHVGSMTQETRALMEDQAVEDIIRFIKGDSLLRPYPGYSFTQA